MPIIRIPEDGIYKIIILVIINFRMQTQIKIISKIVYFKIIQQIQISSL